METRICKMCQLLKPLTNFQKTGKTIHNLRLWTCRKCWRLAHPEKHKRSQQRHDKIRIARGEKKAGCRKWREKLKLAAFLAYSPIGTISPQCECCKESIIEFLSLDHINGGGAEHRLSLNVKLSTSGRVGSGIHFYRELQKKNFPQDPPTKSLLSQLQYGQTPK